MIQFTHAVCFFLLESECLCSVCSLPLINTVPFASVVISFVCFFCFTLLLLLFLLHVLLPLATQPVFVSTRYVRRGLSTTRTRTDTYIYIDLFTVIVVHNGFFWGDFCTEECYSTYYTVRFDPISRRNWSASPSPFCFLVSGCASIPFLYYCTYWYDCDCSDSTLTFNRARIRIQTLVYVRECWFAFALTCVTCRFSTHLDTHKLLELLLRLGFTHFCAFIIHNHPRHCHAPCC